MKTGINLLLWTSFVTEEHHSIFGDLREMGYDGLELPITQGDEAHHAALGKELDRVGLARTTCLGLAPEQNPASADPAVRKVALERLRAVIGMSAAAGAELLCGPLHSAWKVFSGTGPTEDELAWSAEVLHAAAEEAQAAGIRLAIEPLNRFECYLVNTVADGAKLVGMVDHPALGLHYDTHHMHIEELEARPAVDLAAPCLSHVHISENDRGVPGRGQVDWENTFRGLAAAGYDGWLTIEAFSRLDPDFAGAIHIWRDVSGDPYELARDGLAFMRRAWGEVAR